MQKIISTATLLFINCLIMFGWQIVGSDNGNKPARLAEKVNVDKCKIEVVYSHYIFDPIVKQRKTNFLILQIGNNISKYADYGFYRVDSALSTSKHAIILTNHYNYLGNKYDAKSTDFVAKDFSKKELTVREHVFTDHYVYQEPLPNFHWKLFDSTKTVCGHLCHKASCTFRGRTWTAWYCDIASDNGPWKFGGLPGLVLEITDSKKEHKITATSIRNGNNIDIFLKKHSSLKSTRLDVKKAMEHYTNNSDKVLEGFLKNADGSPMKRKNKSRLFYNPIELE